MNGSFASYLPMMVWFIISGLVTYTLKTQDRRLAKIEARIMDVNTEFEVRQMLNDNIEPMKDDIREIKQRLNQLFDLYLQDNRNTRT